MVSGSGTNLQALIDAERSGQLPGRIELVVSNRAGAYALERAVQAGIPTHVAPRRRWTSRDDPDRLAYDEELACRLEAIQPDSIVLAGWMHLFCDAVLERFPGKILNTHPSLLPAFPGRTPVADALAYGVRVTGVTVHLVEPGAFDTGPIILQEAMPIAQEDTEETLHARLHEVEHRLLPRASALLLEGRLERRGRVVRIREPG